MLLNLAYNRCNVNLNEVREWMRNTFEMDYDNLSGKTNETHIMIMQDWIATTDGLLKFRRKDVLKNSGNFSHK